MEWENSKSPATTEPANKKACSITTPTEEPKPELSESEKNIRDDTKTTENNDAGTATRKTAIEDVKPVVHEERKAPEMTVKICTDTGVPKLICPVCDKAMTSLNGYVKHMKRHEPPGGFFCRYCEARFCLEEEVKRHREEVHSTIACRICTDATFTNEDDYRAHITTVHNGVDRTMYKCDKCNAEYKTIEPYKRHMSTNCGQNKSHTCEICAMQFMTKYSLQQHMSMHKGEKQFCCNYCGKTFLQKGRLVNHVRTHTGEKPYKCDVCGKCFAHRESIVTHSSIHTGVRLVECKCCQARFSCHSNLIKHRRSRPDTCGLPKYNPTGNRSLARRSRIPAVLNPNTEIRVSSGNKIIKPGEKEIVRKKALSKTTASKTSPGPKKKGTAKRRSDALEESDSDNDDETDEFSISDSDFKADSSDDGSISDDEKYDPSAAPSTGEKRSKRRRRSEEKSEWWSGENISFTGWSSSDDNDDNNGNNYDSDEKPIKVETLVPDGETSEIVKAEEDETDIFFEKDKMLEVLLDEKDPLLNIKTEREDYNDFETTDILAETEVVIVESRANNNTVVLAEEDSLSTGDALETNNGNCKIVLDDITKTYPSLKESPTVTVKKETRQTKNRPRPRQFKESRSRSGSPASPKPTQPRRKYRKRGEGKEPKPRRMAKLSKQELKARLTLIRKRETTFQCPHCVKIYHIRKPYENHLRIDHQRPEEEIRKIFDVENVGIAKDEIFRCHICEKIYLMEKRLEDHIKLHGPDGKLIHKCPIHCHLFFATKEEAMAHAQEKHREQLLCKVCDKFFNGTDSLKRHVQTRHAQGEAKAKERNFICDKCGKKYVSRSSLSDHVRSDCGRLPIYPCTVCGKHFTTAGILKTHSLLHKDEEPYQCDQCGKRFKVKAQYKTHMKVIHTDYKPYKCHLCPKAYPYRESLLTHQTVHTGIKRFLCNGCGKRFTCISNLQAHRKASADTCGLLPLNAKATTYMGVVKGNLLLGSKPEGGMDYSQTNTLLAKEVFNKSLPMPPEINLPSEPSEPMATVPLNFSQNPLSQLFTPLTMPNYGV